jgi:hypothetical protein
VANFIVRPKKEAAVTVCETLAETRRPSLSFEGNEKSLAHDILGYLYRAL